ncbi:MAG: MFS transporter [Chloroflexi bacterium]|nr:MFS transporter [Chloroflexota bacterium]
MADGLGTPNKPVPSPATAGNGIRTPDDVLDTSESLESPPPRTYPTLGVAVKSSSLAKSLRTTFASLDNRHFLLLWLGMLFLMAATQMQMLSRIYLVYDLTGSGTILGYVSLGIAVPLLLIPLFGGAIADRLDRKLIIQGGQAVVALLALGVGLLINLELISWHFLFVSSMIQGGAFAIMMPARQSIIPSLVGRENLGNAMALNAAGMSAMTMAAPALAGWLYANMGPWNVYYVIAALASGSLVLTSFIPNPEKNSRESMDLKGMFRDIGDGIRYITSQRILLVLLLVGLVTTMLAMPFRFLMPVFVVDIYRQGPQAMGLLMGMMGVGALAGALYVASVGRGKRGGLLILSSFLSAAGLILVATVPIYSFGIIFMLLLGLGDAGRMSLNQALLMEIADDAYRGRVMSIFMLNFGLMPLGVYPAGVLSDLLGGKTVVGMMGAMLLIITAVILITQHQLRRLP